MKYTWIALLAVLSTAVAAPEPIDYGTYPNPPGGYGEYPQPPGGYGAYEGAGTSEQDDGNGNDGSDGSGINYGDYPEPEGGYGDYPTPEGGYRSYKA
ncbi:hypothetical protein E4U21_004056 [Claviceps maximensis]|nr:hypothetical protein E4U21_004056 [Claviceps maximensis]